VLTEEGAAAPPGGLLRVFERVAAEEQDADDDTVCLTLLPEFPDGSYGWARVDRMLGDRLGPRRFADAHTHPGWTTPVLRTPLGAPWMQAAQRSPRVFAATILRARLYSRGYRPVPGRARRRAVGDHPPGRGGAPPHRRRIRQRTPPHRATLAPAALGISARRVLTVTCLDHRGRPRDRPRSPARTRRVVSTAAIQASTRRAGSATSPSDERRHWRRLARLPEPIDGFASSQDASVQFVTRGVIASRLRVAHSCVVTEHQLLDTAPVEHKQQP
jgi:hypothetical protein